MNLIFFPLFLYFSSICIHWNIEGADVQAVLVNYYHWKCQVISGSVVCWPLLFEETKFLFRCLAGFFLTFFFSLFLGSYFLRVAIVSPSDPVAVAAKKMREFRSNSALIVTGSKIQGILTYCSCLHRLFISKYFEYFSKLMSLKWHSPLLLVYSIWLLLFFTFVLQFKRCPYASCGTKSFSWVDSGGKGSLWEFNV